METNEPKAFADKRTDKFIRDEKIPLTLFYGINFIS